MNMEGKRFAAGMLGGLLLGLMVIASAGFTFYSSSFARAGSANYPAAQGAGVTTTATVSTSTTHGGNASAGLFSAVSKSTTSTITSSNLNTTQVVVPFSAVQGATTGPRSPSRLDSILTQPPLTSGFILLPILVAFLLGAILYRTSGPGVREKPTD
jgi:hypothetical protein